MTKHKREISDEERERRSAHMKAIRANRKPNVASPETSPSQEQNQGEEKVKTESVTMSKADLDAFITQKVQAELVKSQSSNRILSDTKVNALDDDDLLTKPAVFFCFKKGYYLSGFTNRGKEISIVGDNGKPLKFQLFSSVKRQNPINVRETQMVHISKLMVYSKSKLELIRRHPRYGVDFTEETPDIYKYNPEKQTFMADAHTFVHNELTPHEVATRLKDKGVSIQSDVERNRAILIDIIAEEMYNQAVSRQQARQDSMEQNIKNTPPAFDVSKLMQKAPALQ